MEIVTPGQFVVFAKDLDSGAPCDTDGRAYADPEQASCVVCDSLEEARTFSEAAVRERPALRIDVFDSEGRTNGPLLTIRHPSRGETSDSHPRVLRRRRRIAWVLTATALPLIAFAYVERNDRDIILPAFIGINMIIAAGRLLWFNLGVREIERARQERLRRHDTEVTPPRDL